ncbi:MULTISPECIES: hypothetical protein [unclassified Spirosoma]|nr:MULTISPECIES: hypothetical protein [unclassified Spirosoma]
MKRLMNVADEKPDLLRQFEAIGASEHRPTHINEWEIINPEF